jgi:hypothetical protein
MTKSETFKIKQEVFQKYLKSFDREELLAMRQDIDWAIGMRESVGYFLLQGIDIRGEK